MHLGLFWEILVIICNIVTEVRHGEHGVVGWGQFMEDLPGHVKDVLFFPKNKKETLRTLIGTDRPALAAV
jgi:hypothetical protein